MPRRGRPLLLRTIENCGPSEISAPGFRSPCGGGGIGVSLPRDESRGRAADGGGKGASKAEACQPPLASALQVAGAGLTWLSMRIRSTTYEFCVCARNGKG